MIENAFKCKIEKLLNRYVIKETFVNVENNCGQLCSTKQLKYWGVLMFTIMGYCSLAVFC